MVGTVDLVSKHSGKPIEVNVTDSINELLFTKANFVNSKFSFTALEDGDYTTCIKNLSPEEKITIGLEIKVGTRAKDYSAMASTKDLRSSELKMKKALDASNQIHYQIQYLREREE